ncbi:hypothetical protein Gotur_032894, partial [Gossypium turneri]
GERREKKLRVFAGIEAGQESGSGYSPLNYPSPNCSSPRPSVLPDGSSSEHWLIILEFSERPKPLEE